MKNLSTRKSTVTTNANLTGVVTSVGNVTSLAASPALTGIPTAPTAAPGTNTTQIATTAFVTAAALTGPQGPTGAQGIQGPAGTNGLDGKTVLNGSSDPVAGTGVNGDFYINTTSNTIFGPKTAGTWTSGVSLVGPAGATGATGSVANVGSISSTSNANGAIISSGVLSLAPADGTNGGIVTNVDQTFAGVKTFASNMITNGTITAGTVTYPNSHGTANQVLTTSGTGTLTWVTPAAAGFTVEVTDEPTATAGQTSFTLSHSVGANSKVKMYINGIRISNSAYTTSGTTVTYNPSGNGSYTILSTDRIQFDFAY